MFDESMKSPVTTEQVMVVTLREVIEGTLFHNENVRLSDALNAESRQYSRYMTLKDAIVFSIATGSEIMRTAFIMVAHDHVIYMTPKDSVQTAASVQCQNGAAHTGAYQEVAATVAAATASREDVAQKMVKHGEADAGGDGKTIHPLSQQAIMETLAALRAHSHPSTDAADTAR